MIKQTKTEVKTNSKIKESQARKVLQIDCITYKVKDEFRSLGQLSRYVNRTFFRNKKNIGTIRSNISYVSLRGLQYCGSCYVYKDIYAKLKKKFLDSTKIIVKTKKYSDIFIRTKDIFKEYSRVNNLKRKYSVNKKEFNDIVNVYYKEIVEDLIENGGYYKGYGNLGKFYMFNYRKNFETHINDYIKLHWDKRETKLKNKKIMSFRLRRAWAREFEDNMKINKQKYVTLIN
ncbi:MAG TPA: hypothetical protein PKD00_02495 [Burkholderiales bacterium]|nr:hypothetical protein [Burkholderiales bacterium]